VIQLAKD
jgi:hypothetical protein